MGTPDHPTHRRELILVGSDDALVSAAVTAALAIEAFVVVSCPSELVLIRRQELRPGLIILDSGSDGRDFVRICRRLRSRSTTPIIALGAAGDESVVARALDAGADDYIRTPLGAGELDARIRRLLRRSAQLADEDTLTAGPLMIDEPQHLAFLDGRELSISPTEFTLLLLLVRHQNRVLTREDVLSHVWGAGYREDHHLLHVAMSRLRRKLGDAERSDIGIQTIAGVGYRLSVEPARNMPST